MNVPARLVKADLGGVGLAMFAVSVAGLVSMRVWAQHVAPPRGSAAAPDRVAATVDGVDISVAQVNRYVQRVLGNRTPDEAARHRLQAEALEQLVKQQIVLSELEKRGEACSQQQLDLAIARFKDELSRQEKSVEEYCRAKGISVSAFERAMRWQLSWNRYLEKSLTDENLQQYFQNHRADFDGTKMRVAQILLAWPDDPAGRTNVERQARAIRDEILAGKASFPAAARQYSQSPSARDGGALAWISRHEPMPEFFARAAFRLQVGEISPPVVSPLGVHLIQCVEIEPGEKTWREVRDELTAAVKEHLFEWNVTCPGTRPDVRYTGAAPYFQPGTQALMIPEHNMDPDAERTGK
jgi:parvulin-like peptidyl-prolyl isomerase